MIKKITPNIMRRDIDITKPLTEPLDIAFVGVFDNKDSSSIPFSRLMRRLKSVKELINFDYRTSIRKGPIGNTMNRIMNISRQVDLIIIAKGNGIPIHTFQMASMNCRLYFWMPDTFTHFKNNSLLESTKFCAYRSATGYGTSLLWSDKLKLPVYHVIDGTDPELYFPENREKIYDIIFIGAADPERTIIYDYLKKK